MYNTKFILLDGRDIYPGYMDRDYRMALKDKFKNQREYMRCGCRNDSRLYYRISEDLKIYPEHNNYKHDQYCSRFRNESGEEERKTGYVVNEEDGEVTAFLTFNPKDYNQPEDIEKEEAAENENNEDTEQEEEDGSIIEKDKGIKKIVEKKDPKLSLGGLIRSINVDTFTERMLNDRKINSRETFSKMVYYRMLKVRASRMKKTLGELTLEKDGVKFFYLPFAGAIKEQVKGMTKCYLCSRGIDGKVYNNLIFPDVMNKAIKEFVKAYGIEPNDDTVMAGFQYNKKSRSGGLYKVLGRVKLFQISEIGLYCRNLIEKDAFDEICRIVGQNKDFKFWVPAEDESIGGIISVSGKIRKILILFRSKKDEQVTYDYSMYEPLVVGLKEPVTEERINEIINML